MIRENWIFGVPFVLGAFVGTMAGILLFAWFDYDFSRDWKVALHNSLNDHGAIVAGAFLAVAAALAYAAVHVSTTADERRRQRMDEQRNEYVLSVFEADIHNLAALERGLATLIVKQSHQQLQSWVMEETYLHPLRAKRIVFDRFADQLGAMELDFLPMLISAYQSRGVLVHEIEHTNALEPSPRRARQFRKLEGRLLRAALVASRLHDCLVRTRQHQDIEAWPDAAAREEELRAELASLRGTSDATV